jgi:hypothetical protein
MRNKYLLCLIVFSFSFISLAKYLGVGADNISAMADEVKNITNLKSPRPTVLTLDKGIKAAKDEITRLNALGEDTPSKELNQAAMSLESITVALLASMDKIRAAASNNELNKELEALKKIKSDMDAAIDPADQSYLADDRTKARYYLLAVRDFVLNPFIKDANAAAWDRMNAPGFKS